MTKYKHRGLSVTKIYPAQSVYNDVNSILKTLPEMELSKKQIHRLVYQLTNRLNRLRKKHRLRPVTIPRVTWSNHGFARAPWHTNEIILNYPEDLQTVIHELAHRFHIDDVHPKIPMAEPFLVRVFDCHGVRFCGHMSWLRDLVLNQKSIHRYFSENTIITEEKTVEDALGEPPTAEAE